MEQNSPAVGAPVEPTVRPRSEWEHLLPYGYAPGHYMGTCRTCGTVCIDLDKRAASCRPCAEAKYAAREFTPAELVLMNEAFRAKPGICGAERKGNRAEPEEVTMNPTAAGEAPVDRPVRPGPEAHKLTDRQIADMAFAVLREHNDNRLWRALTYDSGPYDVTTPTLALCHLARVFFAAGVAAALAGCVDMVQPPDIAVAEELCAKRGGYAHAQRWERGTVLDINCKDGTQLQVRLPKKA